MTGINGEKIPIVLQLGDKLLADGAIVKPSTFDAFSNQLSEAHTLTEPKSIEARLRRVRLAKQVVYYANGTVVPVSVTDVTQLSIVSARALVTKLDDDEGKAGKVISPGNGIDKAIVYELGTPIPIQGKEPLRELEFAAKTYGDVEDVMAAADSFQQTQLLISTIAKPLGTSLMSLPSWAISQITLADGMTIMRQVLPHFLGLPVES